MSTINVNYLQQKSALVAASQKYGVPYGILAGVYGMETDWGNDVNTSSAGAVGAFQFIPSTASSYDYPLTNAPTPQQFVQQTDAAAHYLSDLFNQTKTWSTALQKYSGGGYGLSQVDAKSVQLNQGSGHYSGGGISPSAALLGGSIAGVGAIAAGAGDLAAGADTAIGTTADAGAAASAAGGGAAATYGAKSLSDLATLAKTGGIAALLIDPHFLLRAVEIVGGLALAYFGLKQLAVVGLNS